MTRRPSLKRHTLHQALSQQLLSFCYSSLPALSSCPPFLQPGLRVLPPPCQPPPSSPGQINHLPLEDSAVTPLKPPVHIHPTPTTHHQKQTLLPPGAWPSRQEWRGSRSDQHEWQPLTQAAAPEKPCQDFAKVLIMDLILFVNTFKSNPAGIQVPTLPCCTLSFHAGYSRNCLNLPGTLL